MIKKNVYNGVYEYTTASNPSCNAILFNQEEDSIMKEMHGKFSLLGALQPAEHKTIILTVLQSYTQNYKHWIH